MPDTGFSPASTSRPWVTPVVLLGLALRLLVIALTLRVHPASWFFHQASELGQLAESLRTGQGFSSPFGGHTGPSAFLAPGYPALVAAVFTITGSYTLASAIVLMVLQALFATATVWLLMRVANRLFSPRAANLAGFVWAVSPPLLFLPTVFWESSLSILLMLALLTLALDASIEPSLSTWPLLGIASLTALAVNPSLFTSILGLTAFALVTMKSSRKPASLTLLLCLAIFSLWPLRNARALHTFIPLRTNMGYELWQGNRTGADGSFHADLHPNTNPAEFARYATLGEVAYMREKSAIATTAIRTHPNRFITLSAKRFAQFWSGAGQTSSPLVLLYTLATTLCGLSGLALLARSTPRLAFVFAIPIALFPLPYYISHADFRFRCVLDPLLVLLSAYAFTRKDGRQQPTGTAFILPRPRSFPTNSRASRRCEEIPQPSPATGWQPHAW